MYITKINIYQSDGYDFILSYEDANGKEYLPSEIHKRLVMRLKDVESLYYIALDHNGYIYPIIGYLVTPFLRTDVPIHYITESEFEAKYEKFVDSERLYAENLYQKDNSILYAYEDLFVCYPESVHLEYLTQLQTQFKVPEKNIERNIHGLDASSCVPYALEKEPEINTPVWNTEDVKQVYKDLVNESAKIEKVDTPSKIWNVDELCEIRDDLITEDSWQLYEYDRNAACLIIPKSIQPPIQACHACLLESLGRLGVPYNYKDIKEELDATERRKEQLLHENSLIMGEPGVIYYTTQKETDTHYLVLFHKLLYQEDANYRLEEYRVSGGKLSATKEIRLGIIESLKQTLENIDISKKQRELYEKAYQFMSNAHTILELNKVISDLTTLYDYKDNVATPSEISKDIQFIHPSVSIGKTFRFSTNNPPVQNQTSLIRGMICGEDEWEISAIDITAQDMMMATQGVFENPTIKEAMFKEANPYKAMAQAAGFEFTPDVKDAIKTPTLALFNGMAEKEIYRKVSSQYHDIVRVIINTVKNDPGYKKHKARCREIMQLTIPYRSGLFGSAIVIPDVEKSRKEGKDYHILNQILNGPVQITSLEILSISTYCLFMDLYHDTCAVPDINYSNFKPLVTIHDEIIVMNKKSVHAQAEECLRWYMLPQVEGWARLDGKYTSGKYYIHKQ